MPQSVRFRATVEAAIRHGPDVASYRLHSEKRLPRFSPGQFVHLTLEPFDPASFWPESRVFSVANAVVDRRTLDLTISRQGEYTTRILDELDVGAAVWLKGPYGDFAVDQSCGFRRVALLAGGTGVTPFCAFMDRALSEGQLPVENAILFYGARRPDLLIYRALADRCAARVKGFQVRYFAEDDVADDDPAVARGRLNLTHILPELGTPAETGFFLSGPKPMIDGLQAGLRDIPGIAPEQIVIDAWE